MTDETVKTNISAVPFWWHSIRLADGVVTPGTKTLAMLEQEVAAMHLPDLRGKSVLDIGAWDGYFSFMAEARGAARVLALDHYVWCMDVPAMIRYWDDCRKQGVVPRQYDQVPGMWRPDDLPGKRGFNTAKAALKSRVQERVDDWMTTDLDSLGQFDVVFFLGVLYHLHDPFAGLKRLARVTGELAVIETEAIAVPGYADASFVEFYENNELNHDVNNWWAPTERALVGLCRAAGFRQVAVKVAAPAPLAGKSEPLHYRAVVHALK